MKPFSSKTERTYRFSQRTLKQKLGVEGDILRIGLLEGRSPKDREEGLSAAGDLFEIVTTDSDDT
jgi:hypothetical protein